MPEEPPSSPIENSFARISPPVVTETSPVVAFSYPTISVFASVRVEPPPLMFTAAIIDFVPTIALSLVTVPPVSTCSEASPSQPTSRSPALLKVLPNPETVIEPSLPSFTPTTVLTEST
ncbi:hypothetical protein D3C73_1408490 [compost metagenome]